MKLLKWFRSDRMSDLVREETRRVEDDRLERESERLEAETLKEAEYQAGWKLMEEEAEKLLACDCYLRKFSTLEDVPENVVIRILEIYCKAGSIRKKTLTSGLFYRNSVDPFDLRNYKLVKTLYALTEEKTHASRLKESDVYKELEALENEKN